MKIQSILLIICAMLVTISTLFAQTTKQLTASNGDGWYRIIEGTHTSRAGTIKVWGISGSNRQTNITMHVSLMRFGQGGTINIVNNMYYNSNHIDEIRGGSVNNQTYVLDIHLTGANNPTSIWVESTLPILDIPVFNPTAPTGNVIEASGRVVGITTSAYPASFNNKVGIGTASPESNLHIMGKNGEDTGIKLTHQNEGARSLKIMFDHDHGSTGSGVGGITSSWWNDPVMLFQLARDVSNRGFSFKNNTGSELVRIVHDGNVGIGTTTPSNKLEVSGTIRTKEVVVESTGWPDYIFSDTYELSSLSEVSDYIRENHHLPGIPSAAEVEENGIKLGDMNAKLLEKIEELTLYLIDMKEVNESLKQRIEKLETQSQK